MKTKSFVVFSALVFAVTFFLIAFHSEPNSSIQTIVTQTHQHIKDFKEQLRDVQGGVLVGEGRFARALGLDGRTPRWRNSTEPAVVTHVRGDQHAEAISFVRAFQRLPYTVLVYNLGLKPYSLAMVWSYCNSSKCMVVELDLAEFPSHVADEGIHAFRPLVIQHALSRVGGVMFCEASQRWSGDAQQLGALWARASTNANKEAGTGVLAWPRRAAVTSLTHPRMFRYLHAALDDFLFVQMVDAEHLLISSSPAADAVMRPWIQCALTLDCIMPIGAQSEGCRFDKKPQYRYSRCHGQDASALSIILGLRSGFEESRYCVHEPSQHHWRTVPSEEARQESRYCVHEPSQHHWRTVPPEEARQELVALERNSTERDDTERTPALTHHAHAHLHPRARTRA